MPVRTLQQRYADAVYRCVRDVADLTDWSDKTKKEYGAMALKLPLLVRQAGLVQALTFVEARGKNSQKRILDDLATVLGLSKDELLTQAREAHLCDYMYLTCRVLWALEWFKRFAQAILKVELTDETE